MRRRVKSAYPQLDEIKKLITDAARRVPDSPIVDEQQHKLVESVVSGLGYDIYNALEMLFDQYPNLQAYANLVRLQYWAEVLSETPEKWIETAAKNPKIVLIAAQENINQIIKNLGDKGTALNDSVAAQFNNMVKQLDYIPGLRPEDFNDDYIMHLKTLWQSLDKKYNLTQFKELKVGWSRISEYLDEALHTSVPKPWSEWRHNMRISNDREIRDTLSKKLNKLKQSYDWLVRISEKLQAGQYDFSGSKSYKRFGAKKGIAYDLGIVIEDLEALEQRFVDYAKALSGTDWKIDYGRWKKIMKEWNAPDTSKWIPIEDLYDLGKDVRSILANPVFKEIDQLQSKELAGIAKVIESANLNLMFALNSYKKGVMSYEPKWMNDSNNPYSLRLREADAIMNSFQEKLSDGLGKAATSLAGAVYTIKKILKYDEDLLGELPVWVDPRANVQRRSNHRYGESKPTPFGSGESSSTEGYPVTYRSVVKSGVRQLMRS